MEELATLWTRNVFDVLMFLHVVVVSSLTVGGERALFTPVDDDLTVRLDVVLAEEVRLKIDFVVCSIWTLIAGVWLIVGVSRDVVLELMLDAKPHSTLVTDVRPNALVDGPLVSLQSNLVFKSFTTDITCQRLCKEMSFEVVLQALLVTTFIRAAFLRALEQLQFWILDLMMYIQVLSQHVEFIACFATHMAHHHLPMFLFSVS